MPAAPTQRATVLASALPQDVQGRLATQEPAESRRVNVDQAACPEHVLGPLPSSSQVRVLALGYRRPRQHSACGITAAGGMAKSSVACMELFALQAQLASCASACFWSVASCDTCLQLACLLSG